MEPQCSALFSNHCFVLVPKNKVVFSLCNLWLFPSCLENGDSTTNVFGDVGEKPQLLSWKCPSLLRSKSFPFCLASLIPAPQQQQPQHLPALVQMWSKNFFPAFSAHHIIAKAGRWWGFATTDLAKKCLEISGWGFKCVPRVRWKGNGQDHIPGTRLLWNAA